MASRRPAIPRTRPEKVAWNAGRRCAASNETWMADVANTGGSMLVGLTDDEQAVYARMVPYRWRRWWWAGWRAYNLDQK